jgi:N-acetyl-gamma-glutamyl-phosphate reductase
MSTPFVRAAVLGASGYAGGELVRLLAGHPRVAVTYLGAGESAGRTLEEVHPHLAGLGTTIATTMIEAIDAEAIVDRADVAFCALPTGASAAVAPTLAEAGVRVVDLAADFRLDAGAYPDWYGFEHPAPAWLDKSVYGLPELFGDRVRGAMLVANPGCYPTPVALGLVPVVRAGLVEPAGLIVDGKTGISGAGRDAGEAASFASTTESVRPYRFPRHQHVPEMERSIGLATGAGATVAFVPHLVPAVRGVVTTCYARLRTDADTLALTGILADAYEAAPFVRVLPAGGTVDCKRVRGTNAVELSAVADPRSGTAIVVGAVDNLGKGAAGQAIQNMNLLAGFDEADGLLTVGAFP